MPAAIRALRGATTISEDTPEHIDERVLALFEALFDHNDLHHDDLISVILTATPDIHSQFPATSARKFGLGDVPLLCAREIAVPGALPQVIRVMVHCDTDRPRSELHHVYLGAARSLRDDLPE